MSLSSDEVQTEAMRQRLQAKDTALRSLTKRYLAFAAAVESKPMEECEELHQALTLEIAQYEFAVSKANALIDTNVRQVAEYDTMQQRVEAEMCAPASP
jgi:DNA/RNA-binding domain of Phe-tRNA-synthetase-like protein